jgi:uncharacterized protein involved in exopolysaccharide biosynthesis
MKVGEIVTAEGSLAKDGSPTGNARSVVIASSGQRLFAASSQGRDTVRLWVLLLTGALAVAGIGVIRRVTVPPSYRATASLFAADPAGAGHVLSSPDFQRRVLAVTAPPSVERVPGDAGRVRVAPIARGGWVDVAVTADDADQAAAAANALASAYTGLVADAARADAEATLRQLSDEIASVQPSVDDLEHQLNRARDDAAIGRTAASRLPGLTASLDRARHSRIGLEAFVERVTDPWATTVVLRDQTAHLFERRVLELERQRAVVSGRYGERHPELERLDEAVDAARRDRDWAAAQIVGAVENDYRSERARERVLSEELAAATRQALAGERAFDEAEELDRRLAAQRAVLQTLRDRARELREVDERAEPPARVLEFAVRGVPLRDPVPYWRISALLGLAAVFAGRFASGHRPSRRHATELGPRHHEGRSSPGGAANRPHRRAA